MSQSKASDYQPSIPAYREDARHPDNSLTGTHVRFTQPMVEVTRPLIDEMFARLRQSSLINAKKLESLSCPSRLIG
jgi:hypothetical protein